MVRVKNGMTNHARHKNILKHAKGYRGKRNNSYRTAIQAVEKSLQYAYRDRRVKKRTFRSLWIQRLNAAVRNYGITYSKFVSELKKHQIEINRKILSDIAIRDPKSFEDLLRNIQLA